MIAWRSKRAHVTVLATVLVTALAGVLGVHDDDHHDHLDIWLQRR